MVVLKTNVLLFQVLSWFLERIGHGCGRGGWIRA